MFTTYLYSSLLASILVAHSVAYDDGYEDPNDVDSQNEAGAAGPDSGPGGMSSGGMIALCVIAGVVVIIGFGSAALFYIAKKRQWAMREAIRRSAKQVVRAVKTPLTPRFPRNQRVQARDGNRADREAIKIKTKQQNPTDVEKDAVVATEDELSRKSETKVRGWTSYFSFNRS